MYVYKLICKKNKDLFYIGSTDNLYRRKLQHLYATNNTNYPIYNALLYKLIRSNGGFDNFYMYVLEQLDCSVDTIRKLEDDYIRKLKPLMNTQKVVIRTKEDYHKYLKQRYIRTKDKHIREVMRCREKNYQAYLDYQKRYRESRKNYYSKKN